MDRPKIGSLNESFPCRAVASNVSARRARSGGRFGQELDDQETGYAFDVPSRSAWRHHGPPCPDPLGGLAACAVGRADEQLDGLNVWPAISEGKPSPRDEVVYNIEPFRGAVRKGDWKLVWQALLPPRMELFDISHDTSETTNLTETNPEKVEELQTRIEGLARETVPPLFIADVMRIVIGSPPSTPDMYFIDPD